MWNSDPFQENLIKDFYDNELPARLGGYRAVLKDKDFLVGDKVFKIAFLFAFIEYRHVLSPR